MKRNVKLLPIIDRCAGMKETRVSDPLLHEQLSNLRNIIRRLLVQIK